MKKPKLKVGDDVAVLELDENASRKRHSVKFAKIKSKNGKKVKVDGDNDEFDEEGAHPEKPKKRLLKLTNKVMKMIVQSPLVGEKSKLRMVKLDDSLLKSFDSENENEI